MFKFSKFPFFFAKMNDFEISTSPAKIVQFCMWRFSSSACLQTGSDISFNIYKALVEKLASCGVCKEI